AAARTRTPAPTRTFARWAAGGLAAATTVAAAALPVPGGGWWGAAAAGGTVTAGFLAVGAVRARRR
ncbi:hypothetical protein, partial [Streptomyces sp. CC53]|uniref:hypothetical protein n=2 Tax=unclassified Streptomyces TaxID=2593676 RepID=UPI003528EC12